MIFKFYFIISIIFLFSNTQLWAFDHNKSCSQSDLEGEPFKKVEFLTSDAKKELEISKELFDSEMNLLKYTNAELVSSEVSSSHIVNLLAEEIRKGVKKGKDKSGSLEMIENGVTYKEEEYLQRISRTQQFQKEYVDPKLAELFKVYISAIKEKNKRKNESIKSSEKTEQAKKEMLLLTDRQVQFFNDFIKKYYPSILNKIGSLKSASLNEDLPISYRHGHIVKLRFQKEGEKEHLTVYPRMLYNILSGQDRDFHLALHQWAEFVNKQYEKYKASGVFSDWLNYFTNGWMGISGQEAQEMLPLLKIASTESTRDYELAKWVSIRAKLLSDDEIYFLLGIFSKTIENQIPDCSKVISDLNKEFSNKLKGKKSSNELEINEKLEVDKLAKDVIFWQDMYEVFSFSAAQKLQNN